MTQPVGGEPADEADAVEELRRRRREAWLAVFLISGLCLGLAVLVLVWVAVVSLGVL